MSEDAVTMEKIVALCKRRGFMFQSSEIYGGLASTYDYGHYGVLLKTNVKAEWWRSVVQERDDMVALDAAILMHPRTWEASGHLEGFTDPLVQCLGKCKRRWREDHLREAQPEGELHCPECGGELSEPRNFNLMFETHMGPVQDEGSQVFLRPETAQGIFVNFKNVMQFARKQPAVRHRAGGQGLPQRDHPGQLRLPHARVRADGDRVLRAARRGGGVARPLDGGAHALVHRPRDTRRPPPAAKARSRRALPLLQRDLGHRVPLPDGLVGARGDREPRRLRPDPARDVLAARSSSTSIRARASATCRT